MSPHRLRAAHERCYDLVRRWLIDCARGSCRWRTEVFDSNDEQLADALISTWRLDQPQGDDNDFTWFEIHLADRTMLVEAFATVRVELENRHRGVL